MSPRLASSQPLRDWHDLPALPLGFGGRRAQGPPREPSGGGTEGLGFSLVHPGLSSLGIHHEVSRHLHLLLPVPQVATSPPSRQIFCRGWSCLVGGDISGVVIIVLKQQSRHNTDIWYRGFLGKFSIKYDLEYRNLYRSGAKPSSNLLILVCYCFVFLH